MNYYYITISFCFICGMNPFCKNIYSDAIKINELFQDFQVLVSNGNPEVAVDYIMPKNVKAVNKTSRRKLLEILVDLKNDKGEEQYIEPIQSEKMKSLFESYNNLSVKYRAGSEEDKKQYKEAMVNILQEVKKLSESERKGVYTYEKPSLSINVIETKVNDSSAEVIGSMLIVINSDVKEEESCIFQLMKTDNHWLVIDFSFPSVAEREKNQDQLKDLRKKIDKSLRRKDIISFTTFINEISGTNIDKPMSHQDAEASLKSLGLEASSQFFQNESTVKKLDVYLKNNNNTGYSLGIKIEYEVGENLIKVNDVINF